MSEIYKGYIIYYPETQEFESAIHCDFDDGTYPLRAMLPAPPPLTPLPQPSPLPPVHTQEAIRFPVLPPVGPPSQRQGVTAPFGATPTTGAGPQNGQVQNSPVRQLRRRRPLVFAQAPVLPVPPPPRRRVPHALAPAQPPTTTVAPRSVGSRAGAEQRFAGMATVSVWLSATSGGTPDDLLNGEYIQAASAEGAKWALLLFERERPVGLVTAMRARGVFPIPVDIAVGGRLADLTDASPGAIGFYLLDMARRGYFLALHVAMPCTTFTVALEDADMLRSHPPSHHGAS